MLDFFEKVDDLLFKDSKNLPSKIAVAVSGGCDSMALTFLLQEFCQKHQIELLAVTIDHQIRSNSTKEAQEVAKILAKNQISHQILTISQANLPKSNIESVLRDLRYQSFYDFCQKKQVKHLFLGHHLGDVAENFLIRLFRGSGLDGLSKMAEISQYHDIFLVRPLLDYHKSDLKKYLEEKNIIWFEDETNDDEKFLRNKIRNFLGQLPEGQTIQERIKKASEDIAEIRDFFDKEVAKNAKKCLKIKQNSYLINKKEFAKINKKIALKILALILMEVGQKPYKPRFVKLKDFYDYILNEKNSKKRNFYGCILEEYNQDFWQIMCEENPKIKRSKSFNDSKIKKFLSENS